MNWSNSYYISIYTYVNNLIENLAYYFEPIVTFLLNNILLDTIGLSYTELVTFIENNPSIIQIAELIDNINQFIYYIAFTNIDKTFMGGLIEVSGALNSDHYHDAANPITIFFNSNEMLIIYFDVNVTTSEIENVYINVSNEVFGKLIVHYFEFKTGNIIDVPLVIDNDYLYLNISSDYAISIQIKQTYLVNQILEIILILPLSIGDFLLNYLFYFLASNEIYPFVSDFQFLINFPILLFILEFWIFALFSLLFAILFVLIFKNKQLYKLFSIIYLFFFIFFSGGFFPENFVNNSTISIFVIICPHFYMIDLIDGLTDMHISSRLQVNSYIIPRLFIYLILSFFMFIFEYYQINIYKNF